MKKNYLNLFLLAVALLCCMVASAHDFEVDGIFYNITDESAKTVEVAFQGNNHIAYGDEYTGNVIIPSTVTYNSTIYDVTGIGGYAFSGCTGLASITIPVSVTTIGASVFSGCTGLTSVCIEDGDNVLTIKSDLQECPLESLYLGRNLSYISGIPYNYSPFARITTLKSVTIGDKVTMLLEFLFKDCSNLASIIIPASVVEIGDYTFQYCDLREIHISESVAAIGAYAFTHNNNLEKITVAAGNSVYCAPASNVLMRGDSLILACKGAVIPENTTVIANGAFNGIHGITAITIPASVTAIGEYAFEMCNDLVEIHCSSSTPASVYSTTFKGLFDSATLYVPACGKKEYADRNYWKDFSNIVVVGEIVVDSFSYAVISEEEKTVQVIDYSGSNEIVNIPSSISYNGKTYKVTTIRQYAFKDCANISGITIPNSVTLVEPFAFNGCTNLVNIKVDNGNPIYDSRENCNAVIETATNTLILGCRNSIIPDGVTHIGDSAFYNCSGLTSIIIPKSVTGIGDSAFYKCSGLTSIIIPKSVTGIGDSAFYNCSGLTSIIIPDGVAHIGDSAFYKCSGLTSITIPKSVTGIGDLAFYQCKNLATVVNNSSLIIMEGAIENGYVAYYASKVIDNPGGDVIDDFIFNSIGSLFAYIGSDTDIILPEKNQFGNDYSIEQSAFHGCTDLAGVTLGNGVRYIGSSAFQGCVNLARITFCNNVEGIGDAAFLGCTGLTEVTLGNGVKDISALAFHGCMNLASITLCGNVEEIGDAAFRGCTALKDIYVKGTVPALLDSEAFAEHYSSATLHVPAGTKAAYQSSTSQREEREIKLQTRHLNPPHNGVIGSNSPWTYVNVSNYNPDVVGTLFGDDYFISYIQGSSYPRTIFGISDTRSGRYKIALVTPPWFIETYEDTIADNYADSHLKVRVSQDDKRLATFPCDSFLLRGGAGYGIKVEDAIIPDRSRIDTIFLKDSNGEDYIFNLANSGINGSNSVNIDIEVSRLVGRKIGATYLQATTPKQTFCFLLDQIMLIPVDESTNISTTYWKNFTNIVEMEPDALPGDVNEDGRVSVADITTVVDAILNESSDAAYDVNGDSRVSVADITTIVDIILNEGASEASKAPARVATRSSSALSLYIDPFEINAGEEKEILVNLSNAGTEITAVEFDLFLPAGLEVVSDEYGYYVLPGSRTPNKRAPHSVSSDLLSSGAIHVICYHTSQLAFTGEDGDVLAITIKAADDLEPGNYTIDLKNIELVNPADPKNGILISDNNTVVTDIENIEAEEEGTTVIYDLSGRRVNSLVKGIYIVNGKKVVVE